MVLLKEINMYVIVSELDDNQWLGYNHGADEYFWTSATGLS